MAPVGVIAMNLMNIVKRTMQPEPWAEGEKIPWDEPGFSGRMLKYHLSQDHDMASRRFKIIDMHVSFIDGLVEGPRKVLDLACGPGLYASRFTSLGYKVRGIDFGPASIEYARGQAEKSGQEIDYVLEDMRTADYGEGYGLVLFVFGEFNVFRRGDIAAVLRKAYDSLAEGGVFVTEPHTFDAVKAIGEAPKSWYSGEGELFMEGPHLALMECFWNEEQRVAINRYIILDAETSEVTLHSSTMPAYTNDEYVKLFKEAGFSEVDFHDSLTGEDEGRNDELLVIVARK
ncbi:class I SAM-dependent methyltransferase [Candidatus Bathyarchaeota archaeon]|jgi:SAM-dependent methyltransferase|nr:class I SAM-dependent methyltransferase [Candidatus Bathyarchaeota archaeon]MBT4320360.1 class I SAM-dependent methyltransferase [Candidatus Bathyarchaeota archaeon]MBT4424401.1 class I SAM-dependent methyltransferase [Candidatus Bathyarchaeota archaeon]MBT6605548.1 class I SAM-dependent methyltransferase [Candidatus Bathyarchaeota archaeon]MBT7187858.1 class I SAM-dependent methyltransferase [Candidatus Bathyarchaeota archaeon]